MLQTTNYIFFNNAPLNYRGQEYENNLQFMILTYL